MIIGITQNQAGSQGMSFGFNVNNTGWVYYDVAVSAEWEGSTRHVTVTWVDVLAIGGIVGNIDNYFAPLTLEVNAIGAKGLHGVSGPYSLTGLIPLTVGTFTISAGSNLLYFTTLGAYVGYDLGADFEQVRFVY